MSTCITPRNSCWLLSHSCLLQNSHHIIFTYHAQQCWSMMKIVLLCFLPNNHECSCDTSTMDVEQSAWEQRQRCCLFVALAMVEETHLSGYSLKDDGTDECHVCFNVQYHVIENAGHQLDHGGLFLRFCKQEHEDTVSLQPLLCVSKDHLKVS